MRSRRPSPSVAISLIALFVALGGSSFAGVSLTKNSVGSKQLKSGAVHTADLAKDSVTSAKVKDGSLLRKDFKAGQLPAGPPGATGAPRATGPPGVAAPAGSMLTGRVGSMFVDNFAYPEGATPGSGFDAESDATTISPAATIIARDLFVKEDHLSVNTLPPYVRAARQRHGLASQVHHHGGGQQPQRNAPVHEQL